MGESQSSRRLFRPRKHLPSRTPQLAEPSTFRWMIPWAGWFAFALVLVLWLTSGRVLRHDVERQEASQEALTHAKDLGRGLTALMIEQYYASHRWRRYIRVDSTVTPETVQADLEALEIPLRAQYLIRTPEYLSGMSYGRVILPPLSRELRSRWDEQVALLYETSTLLHWLVWEYTSTLDTFSPMRTELQHSYRTVYPQIASDVNERLEKLGLSERLDVEGYVDFDSIVERCFEIDQAIETTLVLDE